MPKRSTFLVVCALALGVHAFVPAGATDDPVQTLRVYSSPASFVEVGLDDRGTATVAWTEGGALMVATRVEGGKFAEPQTIAPAYVSEVSLDVAPNGKAVVAFAGGMTEGEVMAAVRTSAGRDFGRAQVLVPDGDPSFSSDPEAKISEAGRAVIVWASRTTGEPESIMGATSDPAGSFASAEPIVTGAGVQNPQVDVDASGRALAVWDHTAAGSPNEVVVASAGTSGGFGAPVVVETLEQGPGAPDVAVNASGDAVLGYVDFTSEGEGVSRDKVEARYGEVDGTFGAFQNLTNPNRPTAASEVEVAIDDGGRAAVVSSLTVEAEPGFYGSVSDSNGVFSGGGMQPISAHARVAGPGIARHSYAIAAGGGEFTAFWINDHDEDETLNETWSSTTVNGVFGAAHQLSPEDEGQDDSPDRAHGARNDDGDVVAGWLLFVDGSRAQLAPVAPGPDPIFGDDGDDTLAGTAAGEAIYAAKGNDRVNAGGGGDNVFGEEGNDRLLGQGGVDSLSGGPGRDVLVGGPGPDRFDGGGGRDTCILSSRSEKKNAASCEVVRISD
jgi:hypothetical protein